MQLDKLVAYHKALSDPTRIRMLRLLALGEMSGNILAEKLGVTPPTITHHASKLRDASLIMERREKNTIYFKLNGHFLEYGGPATVAFINHNANNLKTIQTEEADMREEGFEQWRSSVIRNFITADLRLKHIPAQLKKKLVVLEWMAEQLELGRRYPETEINAFIKPIHEDFATLRRELIMHQFMYRDNGIYELNPREVWTNWRELK